MGKGGRMTSSTTITTLMPIVVSMLIQKAMFMISQEILGHLGSFKGNEILKFIVLAHFS